MSFEIGSRSIDVEQPTFRSEDHLLGILQRIVDSQKNTHIKLPGKGEISILPERREYFSNVQDMVEFCSTPASRFVLTEFDEAALPCISSPGRSIRELLWHAAYHVSHECLLEGCSKYDVVKFRHWPNLTRLPVTPNAARICALLTRHPTTIMLVPRMLGIDRAEVFQIYRAAYSAGIADILSRASFEAGVIDNQPEPLKVPSLFRSLFVKFSRL